MSKKIHIPRETLKAFYYERGMSLREVAAALGCDPETVRQRMREYGLATRPGGLEPEEYAARRAASRARCRWTPEVAYAVGLIVADGNLRSSDGCILFASTDRQLVETFCRCLGLPNKITSRTHTGGYSSSRPSYKVAFGDVAFYKWLVGIGLTPCKSLTLGPLNIPDRHFADYLRGYLDGDGCINVYNDTVGRGRPYRRLQVQFGCGSRRHLEWLKGNLTRLLGTSGSLHQGKRIWILNYGKRDSLRLFDWMYHDPDVPCLERKRRIAELFLDNRKSQMGVSFKSVGDRG